MMFFLSGKTISFYWLLSLTHVTTCNTELIHVSAVLFNNFLVVLLEFLIAEQVQQSGSPCHVVQLDQHIPPF